METKLGRRIRDPILFDHQGRYNYQPFQVSTPNLLRGLVTSSWECIKHLLIFHHKGRYN